MCCAASPYTYRTPGGARSPLTLPSPRGGEGASAQAAVFPSPPRGEGGPKGRLRGPHGAPSLSFALQPQQQSSIIARRQTHDPTLASRLHHPRHQPRLRQGRHRPH
ncbi:hypothetical protein F2982_13285 [Rhizobium sp. BG4]|nr:hypothetical protein F2982_13285 [Rhizobium sp. BG4]